MGKVPFGHWKPLTCIAGLRHDRVVAPVVFEGPINGEISTAWIEQYLVPTLEPKDVVILDSLDSHPASAAL